MESFSQPKLWPTLAQDIQAKQRCWRCWQRFTRGRAKAPGLWGLCGFRFFCLSASCCAFGVGSPSLRVSFQGIGFVPNGGSSSNPLGFFWNLPAMEVYPPTGVRQERFLLHSCQQAWESTWEGIACSVFPAAVLCSKQSFGRQAFWLPCCRPERNACCLPERIACCLLFGFGKSGFFL